MIMGLSKFDKKGSAGSNFERDTIENRLIRLRAALGLLTNWPNNFLDFCAGVKAPYSIFYRDNPEIPYWLGSVLRRHVFNAHAPVSLSEMNSIMQVADRDDTKAIRKKIRLISGRDPTRFLSLSNGVDDDVADTLLASIDQEISGLSEKQRAILLRDKVMFITARCLKLNVSQLLSYQTKVLIEKECCKFSFWDRVETRGQVEEMLSWYQIYVRPIFGDGECTSLFTSSWGQVLHHSAVGSRFHRAVQGACLDRTILNWRQWIADRHSSL